MTPLEKLRTAILWFAPFLFTSLASPLSVLAAPLAVERFLSESPYHWGTSFHYSAPLAPIIAMSAADGLARLSRRLDAAGVSAASSSLVWRLSLAMAVVSAVVPGRQPLWRVFAPSHYKAAPAQAAGLAALMVIPPDTSVVAQAAIAPHLSERAHIFVLEAQAPDADYVITAASLSPWPISTFEELRKIVDDRFGARYDVIFDRSGWRVWRRARRT